MKKLLLIILLVLSTSNAYAALDAATVWEVRTTGVNTNGGGFYNRNPGTSVDYSQQNAAQLTLTDGATTGIGVTTFTSATGGFTAAMAGNLIYIASGTNATVGYYEITVYTNGNTVTLDRAPDNGVGGVSGANFKVGGAVADPEQVTESVVAGNTVYVKSGSYNVIVSLSVAGGNGTPIFWLGYNATRTDEPTGANRPIIDGQSTRANCITGTGTANVVKNFRFTGGTGDNSTTSAVNYVNCRFDTAGSDGYAGGVIDAWKCEFDTNTAKGATTGTASGIGTFWCYVHDNSSNGVDSTNSGAGNESMFSVFDSNAGDGFQSNRVQGHLIGNVSYNNTGVSSDGFDNNATGTASLFVVINNIAVSNGVYGFNRGSATGEAPLWFDYNLYNGNGTGGLNNYTAGANDLTSDPLFTNAAAGDFTLQSGSPCLDAGLQPGTDIGLTGDYKWNIGVDQDDVTAAGGGGGASFFTMGD